MRNPPSFLGLGLAFVLGLLISWAAYPLLAHIPADTETHHWHETVRVDSFHHAPIAFNVPGPGRLRVDTVYPDGGHSHVTYQQFTNNVYADCDTAHGYDTEYGDSLVKVKYHADVCGRILASQITYECYRKTITRTETVERESAKNRLYATANSNAGIGLQYSAAKWMAGYSYQFGNSVASFGAHQIQVGINLIPNRRGNH